LQKKTIERNVHFAETIREYKNVVKKNLKIVEHANVATLQNQSQSQSKNRRHRFVQIIMMMKIKHNNAYVIACMIEINVITFLNQSNQRIENAIRKKENEQKKR
jgi:hypothetical protein